MSEKIRIKFLIKEKEFDDDLETLTLYFQLLIYGCSKESFKLFGRQITISNIVQAKSDENAGWCEQPDRMETYFDGFRILASYGNQTRYFVYVNATETTYTTGYYYLTIVYTTEAYDSTDAHSIYFHRGLFDNYPSIVNYSIG